MSKKKTMERDELDELRNRLDWMDEERRKSSRRLVELEQRLTVGERELESREQRIQDLGGSELELAGGRLLGFLLPVLGWKGVRRMQHFAYRFGWQAVLNLKDKRRRAANG